MAQSERTSRTPMIMATLLMFGGLLLLPFDRALSDLARFHSRATGSRSLLEFGKLIESMGKGNVLVLLAFVVGLCGLRKRSLQMLVAAIVWPVKATVKRKRPRDDQRVSFPSGDTASIVACATPIALELPGSIPVVVLLVCTVGGTRVMFGAHYPSDVLVGAAVALVAGLLGGALTRSRRMHSIIAFTNRHFVGLVCTFLVFSLLGWLTGLSGRDGEVLFRFCKTTGAGLLLCIVAYHFRTSMEDRQAAGGHRLNGEYRPAAWIRWGGGACAALGLSLSMAALVVPWFLPLSGARESIFGVGLLLLVATLFLLFDIRNGRYRRGARIFALGLVLLLFHVLVFVLPTLDKPRSSAEIEKVTTSSLVGTGAGCCLIHSVPFRSDDFHLRRETIDHNGERMS